MVPTILKLIQQEGSLYTGQTKHILWQNLPSGSTLWPLSSRIKHGSLERISKQFLLCQQLHNCSPGESNDHVHLQIPTSSQQSNTPVCQSLTVAPPAPYLGCKTTGFIFKTKFKKVLPVKTKPKQYSTPNCIGYNVDTNSEDISLHPSCLGLVTFS